MALSKSLQKFVTEELAKEANFYYNPEHLTATEVQFAKRANERMMRVHRPSWPDFLIEGDDHELCGVEVKSGGDTLSPNQIRTFDLLTQRGIMKIYLWDADHPSKLVPWEKARKESARVRRPKQKTKLTAQLDETFKMHIVEVPDNG